MKESQQKAAPERHTQTQQPGQNCCAAHATHGILIFLIFKREIRTRSNMFKKMASKPPLLDLLQILFLQSVSQPHRYHTGSVILISIACYDHQN